MPTITTGTEVTEVLMLGTISSIIRFNGTLSSGWTRIATGPLVLAFIDVRHAITLGRNRRA